MEAVIDTLSFPDLPTWLSPAEVLKSNEHTFIFPVDEPVGHGPAAYLRDAVLPHMVGLPERPAPELAYEAAVLELATTYPDAGQATRYGRLRETFPDGTPVVAATPIQLRLHALATHGYAADGRGRPYESWLGTAKAALSSYRRPAKSGTPVSLPAALGRWAEAEREYKTSKGERLLRLA